MNIGPKEECIVGHWSTSNGNVVADENCKQIESLLPHLRKIAQSASGWEILFVDPADGRYWELIYAHSELHGGGPPTLRHLSIEVASDKYELTLPEHR